MENTVARLGNGLEQFAASNDRIGPVGGDTSIDPVELVRDGLEHVFVGGFLYDEDVGSGIDRAAQDGFRPGAVDVDDAQHPRIPRRRGRIFSLDRDDQFAGDAPRFFGKENPRREAETENQERGQPAADQPAEQRDRHPETSPDPHGDQGDRDHRVPSVEETDRHGHVGEKQDRRD